MAVGNVTSMVLKSTDSLGEALETTITNKRLFINPNTNYTDVDTLARLLNNLTTNTYADTDLITVISVNEKLAE